MTIIAYKVSGPNSNLTYYGYATVETADLVPTSFLIGAKRADSNSADRGDVRFLAEHDNDATSLQCTTLDVVEDEYEALLIRNQHRADDRCSITGPTMWPYGTERLAKDNPEKLKEWQLRVNNVMLKMLLKHINWVHIHLSKLNSCLQFMDVR